jgi:membrane protease YdiL (CAAX protease family)
VEALRTIGPLVAALGGVLLFDHMTRRRGLDPPGFREPLRRFAALVLLTFCLYVGVFAALGSIGRQGEVDLSQLASWQLFTLHALFALTIVGWWASGYLAVPPLRTVHAGLPDDAGATTVASSGWGSFTEQFGLRATNLRRELAIGAVAGVGAWLAVLASVLVFALVLSALSGEELLPQAPPAVIPWLAGRPILLRLAIAASAGLVEELFFRGFLQPRIGIGLSTLFFALAHLSYDQPIMLVGVTLLSVLYGLLTRWRQNIWPAIVAHFLFDAIQLLVVIPAVLELFRPGGP